MDIHFARRSGGVSIEAGPSFDDYAAMAREQQMIAERCEVLQESVHTLEGLVTWFSLNLPNPETNPHLKVVVQEVEKKKKEIATLVRYKYIN